MPPGLIISKSSSSGGNATWQVSGTPSDPGSGTGVYTFTDSNPGAVTMTVNFNILSPVVVAGTFPQGTAGRPFPATNLSASGGSGSGYTYVISGGNLPAGLNLASSGAITGTSSAAGTFNFTIQATDSGTNVGSANFSITINPAVSMSAAAPIQQTVGQSYSGSFAGSGGTAPLSYSITAGALPPGAALSSTSAALSGTASAASTGSFSVTLTDANGSTATSSVSHTISPLPTIQMASPAGIAGTAYAQTISFTGALSSASLSAGALPPGLVLSGGGTAVSGNPTSAGSFSFTLSGADTNGVLATASFSITIAGALSIPTTSLPNATPGVVYSASVSALGGTGAISFSISAGSLPAGLTLGSTGSISGTPTAPGLFSFTIMATDSASNSASKLFSIQVSAPPVVISTVSLPSASIGSAYSATVSASGGSGPLSFSLVSGSLPVGLSLASSGLISGTPVSTGSSSFTMLVADVFSNSASRAFTLQVISPLNITSNTALPPTTVGVPVLVHFQTAGGTAPFTWSMTGLLASGLTFSSGVLSGTPTASTNSQFTIQVSDANGAVATALVTQMVNPALTIANPNLGGPFSRSGEMDLLLVGTGGSLPYSWTVSAGQLPPGVLLNPQTGRLRGIFYETGSYPITVRLRDAAGAFTLRSHLLVVGDGPQFQSNGRLPDATTAAPYRFEIQIASSLPIVEWQLGSGPESLPPGVNLVSRELVGTPTQEGKYAFEISVRDQNGSSAVQALTLIVNPSLETLDSFSPPFSRGRVHQWTPKIRGGTAPFRYLMLHGSPPVGMQLNSNTGEISGAPQRTGDFGFTIQVTDANGATARRFYQLRVEESFSLRPGTLASVLPLGREVNGRLEILGGSSPYQVHLSEGVLPPGLALSGLFVTGTPTQAGSYVVSFTASDASGQVHTQKWTLTISSGLEVFPTTLEFRVVANSSISVRQTVKFHSFPMDSPVQLESTAAWLRVSSPVSRTPGFVEVWVDPLLLPPGTSDGEIILKAASQTRIPVSVERVDAQPAEWSTDIFPGPGGAWGVLLQAHTPQIPFTVSLDSTGIQQFILSENRGEILAPESFLVWLDRRPGLSLPQRESGLAIRNLATGQEQRMVVPAGPVASIEASVSVIKLNASHTASLSSSFSVNFRSASATSTSMQAVAGQSWLVMDHPRGSLAPNHVIRFSARSSGLQPGLNTAVVEIYDSSGKVALRLPVELWVGELVPPVEISTHAVTLSQRNPNGSVVLRNLSNTPVSFSARTSSSQLRVSNSAGLIPANGAFTLELSAVESALGPWSRHSLLLALSQTDLRIVEVDFAMSATPGNCPSNAPVLSFLQPGAAFRFSSGETHLIRVAVRNPCGEVLTGAALSLVIPQDSAISLVPAKDGTWFGSWNPFFPADSMSLEAIWLDPANRQSATRWLSGVVEP